MVAEKKAIPDPPKEVNTMRAHLCYLERVQEKEKANGPSGNSRGHYNSCLDVEARSVVEDYQEKVHHKVGNHSRKDATLILDSFHVR